MTTILKHINEGDIVKPPGEDGWVYIHEIGKDINGHITQYTTYRVVNEHEAASGTNSLPITKDAVAEGDLTTLKLSSPVIEIRNNRIRTITATDDTYFVQEVAVKTNDPFQKIADNIHHEIGANNEKYGATSSGAVMRYGDITGPVVGERNLDDATNAPTPKSPTKKRLSKANSLVNVRDMYLDHAAHYGLISQETLQLLGTRFTTLQQAWDAAKQDKLAVAQTPAKTFKQAFPNAKKYMPAKEKIWPASQEREEKVAEDPTVKISEKYLYTLDKVAELGLISERTKEILSNQPDDADCRSCDYLEEAFRLVGAHQYFVYEYEDPDTGEKISKEDARQIIREIEGTYNSLSKGLAEKSAIKDDTLETIKTDLSSAKTAFYGRDDIKSSVFTHHDFARAVVPKLEDQVTTQRDAVDNRNYDALGITPPA